ncbi:hypothetical protein ACJX0J_014724 [Zea mays]
MHIMTVLSMSLHENILHFQLILALLLTFMLDYLIYIIILIDKGLGTIKNVNFRKEQHKGFLYFTYDEAQNDCLPKVGHWNMMNKYFVKINITKYLFCFPNIIISRGYKN